MLKNYFHIAWRNIRKNKTVALINILGLTIGLTCCLLISLFIQQELNFDKFQSSGDRIARVIMEYSFGGSSASNKGNFTSVRVATILKRTFPEVEAAVKMVRYERIVHSGGNMFSEKEFMYADPAFFKVFSFPLVKGDPQTVLSAPYDLVLTASVAKKYFGNENPVGRSLQLGNDSNVYRITGVMEDCPSNSQIHCDFIASFASLGLSPEYENTYWDANYTTYLLLKDRNAIGQLQAKLPAFMKKEMLGQGATVNFYLEPFNKIHLFSPYDSFVPNYNISYIYILSAVALLILIIAGSTYINLSTARSVERAKEVGIRKVIGATRSQIFWQFLCESVLTCLAAVSFSLVIATVLLPAFNQLTNKQLQAGAIFSYEFITWSFLVALTVSLLAGIYPAIILTGFQPVKVLKGSFKNTSSGQVLRKSLVVFQFAIYVFLIVATIIVQRQLFFIQTKKLGYDRAHVIVLPLDQQMFARLPVLKQQP